MGSIGCLSPGVGGIHCVSVCRSAYQQLDGGSHIQVTTTGKTGNPGPRVD